MIYAMLEMLLTFFQIRMKWDYIYIYISLISQIMCWGVLCISDYVLAQLTLRKVGEL